MSEPRSDQPATPVDGPTERLPVIAPRSRLFRSTGGHRAQAGEAAALAFVLPHAIPAQRLPDPVESRPAA